MLGTPSDGCYSFHSAGEDRDITLGPKPPKELSNKLCHGCECQEAPAPGRSQTQVPGLGEGFGVLSGWINRSLVPPNTRLGGEEDKDISGP